MPSGQPALRPHSRHCTGPDQRPDQLSAGVRMGLREAARDRVLWALLIAVPVVFVLLAVATTPEESTALTVRESGRTLSQQAWPPDITAAPWPRSPSRPWPHWPGCSPSWTPAPATGAWPSQASAPPTLLASRLAVIALGALLATAASLAVAATVVAAECTAEPRPTATAPSQEAEDHGETGHSH
ncbi:hypothetical protein ACFYO0_42360 [Streptomyces sp. NPDC006365]|uniref:hypothetical protein n=1 Tax=Streptomyces sp. NPDC006365 TaxID=3364744 RepID=UPI00369715A9